MPASHKRTYFVLVSGAKFNAGSEISFFLCAEQWRQQRNFSQNVSKCFLFRHLHLEDEAKSEKWSIKEGKKAKLKRSGDIFSIFAFRNVQQKRKRN